MEMLLGSIFLITVSTQSKFLFGHQPPELYKSLDPCLIYTCDYFNQIRLTGCFVWRTKTELPAPSEFLFIKPMPSASVPSQRNTPTSDKILSPLDLTLVPAAATLPWPFPLSKVVMNQIRAPQHLKDETNKVRTSQT
jgi:hypothetical protein